MAEVILKNIKKIYPHQEPKKKKKGEPEKKTNLQITEEGVLAVDNFNLHIQDKEFIVLVGPSGCGKSTTLRMVAGLEEISGGELYIGGQLMNDVAPKDRDISMVFQNYALYPHMTVRENIAFPLKLRKMDKAEINQRVEQAAEILDITEYLDTHPIDAEAICYFNHHIEMRRNAMQVYADKFGPLTIDTANPDAYWDWAKQPLPWEGGGC